MSKLVSIGIDVTKIPKQEIKNGKWLNLDVWINDEPDKYGKDASVNVEQSKEQRDAKEKKVYIGNGKKKFGWEDQPAPAAASSSSAADDDEIPF